MSDRDEKREELGVKEKLEALQVGQRRELATRAIVSALVLRRAAASAEGPIAVNDRKVAGGLIWEGFGGNALANVLPSPLGAKGRESATLEALTQNDALRGGRAVDGATLVRWAEAWERWAVEIDPASETTGGAS